MDAPFNRRDIGYTIISRFEEAFRCLLVNKLPIIFGSYQEGIPQGVIDKAKDRTSKTHWEDASDFLEDIEFPDLKDIVSYNNLYKKIFPESELTKDLFDHIMDELYYLRCKIAHIRGYFNSLDLDKLLENSKKVADCLGQYGKEFLNFTKILEEHPGKVVIPMPLEFSCDYFKASGIPNNVPTPDYEYEGGFVGREADIKKVISLLEADRYPVVTISGAGGVGKTALAQRIIQKILEHQKIIFDGIVWLSAKETQLSYLGIEDVEPTVKNYEQLLDTISETLGFGVLDSSKDNIESDVNTIFSLFPHMLIVIDNLETITDERIINFILEANPQRKILVTSRKGLGQVEIRHDLKQLSEKEAIYLFRHISRDKGIESLAKLDDNIIKNYVKKVSCYPLAIKWVIGQVAKGKDINVVIESINEKTSDISRFCFEQIYFGLSLVAKKIICALSYFDEPPAAGILNYVVNIESKEEFEDGIQELILISFVIPEQHKDNQGMLSTKYNLLSLTRGYVRQQLDKESVLKRDIEDRLRSVQLTIEEAERAKKQYRFSLFNLGAITDEEKVAAVLATSAYNKYQAGRYRDALEDYKKAAEIAPCFSSVYRNWAVMESKEGHQIEADKLMAKAAGLNKKDPQIWHTWGNMKRREDKMKDALEMYEKAYAIAPGDFVIHNALGQAKARLGDHAEADKLFRKVFHKESTLDSSRKHEIINLASLAENLKHWSGVLLNDRNYAEAENKIKEALDFCEKLIELDKNDPKSINLFQEILIEIGFFYRKSNPTLALSYFKKAINNKPSGFKASKRSLIAAIQAAWIHYSVGEIDQAKDILSSVQIQINDIFIQDYNLKNK